MPAALNLPPSICAWLDSWGPELSNDLRSALDAASNRVLSGQQPSRPSSSSPLSNMALRVGTDCSGVESPLHALEALGVSFKHIFSSESASAPRKVIAANSKPGILLDDVKCQTMPVPHVDLYISGFSCKPFSMLHWKTELLNEPEAAIFFAVLQRIEAQRPAAYVLENVEGISRCLNQILPMLGQLGYQVSVLTLNPIDLGEPVHRPRVYFVGVRSDVAKLSQQQSQQFYETVWSELTRQRKHRNRCEFGSSLVPLWRRLLPDDHGLVSDHAEQRKQKWEEAKQQGYPDKRANPKWRQRHQDWSNKAQVPKVSTEGKLQWDQLGPDSLYLHLPRERDAWSKLIKQFDEPCRLVADLSQNLGRIPCRTDGSVPTITPGAHIVLGPVGRILLPIEKLLLHALPLHRMVLPDDISSSEIEDMGGNMMHLQTVAVAMAVALSLVDWGHPLAFQHTRAPAVQAVQAAQIKRTKGRKNCQCDKPRKCRAEKQLELRLRARFGLKKGKIQNQRKVVAKPKKKSGPSCLRGTRWQS